MLHKTRGAVFAFLAICSVLAAQQGAQQFTNDSVIKLIKAGLSDDLIISTVNTLPGAFNTSPDGLIALKAGGASEKVMAAIILKASLPPAEANAPIAAPPPVSDAAAPGDAVSATPVAREPAQQSFAAAPRGQTGSLVAIEVPHRPLSVPRVFLQSASKGANRNADRDQSMEMSKDLEKGCPGVQVTILQQVADYTVLLNHIEAGFVRDNQIQVANKEGDLISKTKEGGSIAAGMKRACTLIVADWAKR